MDFTDYFAKRNELVLRMLVDVPDAPASQSDGRFIAVGALCLGSAVALEVWASHALADAGYFARASIFLEFLLLAGACVIITTKIADVWLARLRVQTRETLKERTVEQLISADRVVASKLADRMYRSAQQEN